jgi:glycosyltransferase A (GT-A) superfamily protein (DUF2064 family)
VETLILFAGAHASPSSARPSRIDDGSGSTETASPLPTAFLLDTAAVCGRWLRERIAVDPNRRVVVHGCRGLDAALLEQVARLAGGALVVDERSGPLGADGLRAAFESEFARGARAVAAIGDATPTLPPHLLLEAFRALVWERVVLGPTFRGGVWLLGSTRPGPDFFVDAPWTGPTALPGLVERARRAGAAPALLPYWYGVEQPEDLAHLDWHVQQLRSRHPFDFERTRRALEELDLRGARGDVQDARAVGEAR